MWKKYWQQNMQMLFAENCVPNIDKEERGTMFEAKTGRLKALPQCVRNNHTQLSLNGTVSMSIGCKDLKLTNSARKKK
jgi:hypothetical protein